tara:strand:- start:11481 stop:11777 length:297 start_codon:yes stop_codon:yes gene_type:complete
MLRYHTISRPRTWIEEVRVRLEDEDEDTVTPGYWQETYQENVPFTPDEELARDAEEVQSAIDQRAREIEEADLRTLREKLRNDTMDFEELKEYLRKVS